MKQPHHAHPPDTGSSLRTMTPHAGPRVDAGRRYGIRDGLFQAVTQGGGEQYLSAFALLFQATPFHLSLLSAIPQLLGTWAQLLSVKVAHWFPDRKTHVLWGIAGQGLAWIPILALPLLWPTAGPWLLLAGAAFYFACTHFTAPAWTGLITDLLEPNERGSYFARRARAMSVISFLTLAAGGGLLSLFTAYQHAALGFAVLFLAAGLCRAASAWTLAKVPGLPPQERGANPTGFFSFLRRDATANFYRFLLFSGLMHAAVLVAGPFFVMYMIQDLHLPYWQYGAWMAAGLVGQFMTFTAWGRFSDRFGNKALLTMTGLSVPILPMLYLISTAWPFLVVVNYFGGIVWAGLSLGLQNYVFDAVTPPDRPKAVAVVSIVNAVGWAAGTFLGSWLIGVIPPVLHLGRWTIAPVSNLPLIFFVSGALRLVVSLALVGRLEEPRDVERPDRRRLFWELPLVEPLGRVAWRSPALDR